MKAKFTENRFYRFYQRYFKARLGFAIALLALIIVGVATGNIGPLLYGRMIDFITESNLTDLRLYIFIYFFVTMGSVGLGILEGYLGQMFSFKVTNDVKKNLFEKIIRMRFRKLDDYTVGELISRLESDAGSIVDYYINFATSIALIVFNLVVSLIFVFSISAQLSVISILFIPASVIITLIFRRKFRTLSEKQKEYFDKYYGFINEAFSNIKGVRSYQLEDSFAEKFKGFIGKSLGLLKRSIFLGNSMGVLSQLVTLTFTLVIIYLSAVLIMDGKLTIGSMVAFNTYIDKLFNAVSRILNLNISAQNVIVSMDRIEKLENEPDESALYLTGNDKNDMVIYNVSINNLSFAYKDNPVLQNLSITCDKPGLYCIVGKNGCGKSTLAKLLIRFYDPDSGAVRYNGTDVRELGLKEVRDNFIYIQKEVFITNDTLINNIRFAKPDAAYEEVATVCGRVGLTGMIEELPEGYETKLGENGSLLSSGQKQKINIARVLLRKSPVLLLDEVTSDLDGAAEKEIIKIIQDLAREFIVFLISHKVTSIMNCDVIYVMSEGRIVAEGTHAQLLGSSDLYRSLFDSSDQEVRV